MMMMIMLLNNKLLTPVGDVLLQHCHACSHTSALALLDKSFAVAAALIAHAKLHTAPVGLQVALRTIPPDLRSVVACLTAEGADSDTFADLTTLYKNVSDDQAVLMSVACRVQQDRGTLPVDTMMYVTHSSHIVPCVSWESHSPSPHK
jgi:hypothetical protein